MIIIFRLSPPEIGNSQQLLGYRSREQIILNIPEEQETNYSKVLNILKKDKVKIFDISIRKE